jgi:Haem-binding domain
MKTFRRVVKWLLIVVVCGFIALQFYRPARTNPAVDPSQSAEAHLEISPQVAEVLDQSCMDCHSNKTRWPWYTNVSPVSWFVANHVEEGRRHVNFSEWGTYNQNKKLKRLQEICEQVEDGFMPLSSYTPLHPGSELSAEEKKLLCDWANAERTRISSQQTASNSGPQF